MAATLTGQVSVRVNGIYQSAVGAASGQASLELGLITSLASGVGASQWDKIYSERDKSVAASGTYDIDLAGSLTDAFGVVITFARVKGLLVMASALNTNNVVVGAAAATQFLGPLDSATSTESVRPGGLYFWFAPDATAFPVGAGATDKLRFTNSSSGTAVVFTFVVFGCSA